MKPDTITIRIVKQAEIDADSADLTIVVEGTSVFSGSEAFKKAKELRALIDALQQARADAATLGVAVLGIHELTEATQGQDYNPEYIMGDVADRMSVRGWGGQSEIGFHLGNSTTAHLDLRAQFRVSPIGDSPGANSDRAGD